MNPEICDDGIDNNCDAMTDCDDWACWGTPGCGGGEGDTCDTAIDVGWTGGTFYGSTAGMNNDYEASCGGGARSPDVVYVGTVPFRVRVIIDTVGSDYDTVLHIRSGDCWGGREIACDDDAGGGVASRIDRTFEAGTYYIFVDGYSDYSSGNYVLNIRAGG
jgi:hypothetical protein